MTRKDDPQADPDALAIVAKEGVPVSSSQDVSGDTLATYDDEPINPADTTAEPPDGRYAAPQASEPTVESSAPTTPKKQERGRHRRK